MYAHARNTKSRSHSKVRALPSGASSSPAGAEMVGSELRVPHLSRKILGRSSGGELGKGEWKIRCISYLCYNMGVRLTNFVVID